MADAVIVDSHHHLWDVEQHVYPWLRADPIFDTFIGDYRPICHNYLISDYLADAEPAGVTKSVHIQCEFDPSNPTGETEWLQGVADQYGFPHGIVGWADLAQPDVEALLEDHARFPNMRGIRQNLNWDAADPTRTFAKRGDYLTDPAWEHGFSLLERFEMSFDLQLLPQQMAEAAPLVARHPATLVIVDHAGLPLDRNTEQLGIWRSGMRSLASLPNTAVKLSGFAMIDHQWSVASIRPLVLETIEMFGADRCMFASNFPVDGLYADYADLFNAYREIASAFSASEQAALFGGNAERFYRI